MNTLKPISRATLSEQVALQIVDMISTGKWKTGEKLPSESDLCRALHVGRFTLREALRSLAFVGMVQMRPGEGTYVSDGTSKLLERILAPGFLSTEKDLLDMAETRLVLETELVALCAQRATDADLAELERLVGEMQESIQVAGERFLELDLEFHLTIAALSKNLVLAQLLRTIRGLLREYIMKTLQVPGARELACAHHREVLEALKQHDASKAWRLMRTHLRTFQREYKLLLKAAELEIKPQQDIPVAAQQS